MIHFTAQAGVRYYLVNPHIYIDSNIKRFLNIMEACRYYRSILKRYTPKVIIFNYNNVTNYISSEYDRLSTLLPFYRSHQEIRDLVLLKGNNEKFKTISIVYPFNSIITTIMVGNMEE